MAKASKCTKKRVVICKKNTTCKRGNTIIEKNVRASFMGKQGAGCKPRTERVRNPKTGRLKRVWHGKKPTPPPKQFRTEFARQAKACKGKSRGAFITCMKRLEY